MRITRLLNIFTITGMTCLLFAVGANCEYYYYNMQQVPLSQCDSIITLKYNPSYPTPDFGALTGEVPAIDPNRAPIQIYNQFFRYYIKEGHTVSEAFNKLDSLDEVLFAFPSYLDIKGNLYEETDIIILSFPDSSSQREIDSIYDEFKLIQICGPNQFTGSREVVITSLSEKDPLSIANQFCEMHLVNYAQAAFAAPTPDAFEPNDPLFNYQYNLYNYGQTGGTSGIDIGAESAWNFTMGDSNVIVAILDEGFIYNHEDLDASKILWIDGYDFVGGNYKTPFPDSDPSTGDSTNHGVACQGIICAKTDNQIGISGIAPNCYFLPIKCADDYGGWTWDPLIYDNALSYALQYAIYNGFPMVVSCSWGWPNGYSFSNIDSIIAVMASWGVPCVFSTGNLGEYLPIGNTIKFPASLPTTIGVGAIKKTGDHWSYSGSGAGIDVVAPSGYYRYYDAGDILTLDQMGELGWNSTYASCAMSNENYICTFGGTSAAAPQVAAIVALLKSEYRLRPEMEIFNLLKMVIDSSAKDGIGDNYDSLGWDPVYGFGLASAFRALLAVVRGDADNNGTISIIDVSYLINFLYKGGPPPQPDVRVGDANCDGAVNVIDTAYLLQYLYHSGPKPPPCFNY